MAKSYRELAARSKADWTPEVHAVHAAAGSAFRTEMAERAALGASLAEARTRQNLTQPDLAELSGVRQPEISRVERGVANATQKTLHSLLNALNLKLAIVPRDSAEPRTHSGGGVSPSSVAL